MQSDLFAALGGRRYDLILANPPYVSAEALAAFPPEYAAEPALAHAGGADGLDIVRRILADAGEHLSPDGTLMVEVGTGRDILEQRVSRSCHSCGWTRPRARARCSRFPRRRCANRLAARLFRGSKGDFFVLFGERPLLVCCRESEPWPTLIPSRTPSGALTPMARFIGEEVGLANRNYGILLEALRHDVTPTGLHYLLNHFDVPYVPDAGWQVEIAGRVGRPGHALARRDQAAARRARCASRWSAPATAAAAMTPRYPSMPWTSEAVGTARVDRHAAAPSARSRGPARRRRRDRLHRRRPRLRPRPRARLRPQPEARRGAERRRAAWCGP